MKFRSFHLIPLFNMIKCNQLQLITITNYDDPMSANQHQELPVGPVNYCFQQFTEFQASYFLVNRNYSAIIATLQITSYALGV
jgi:hypothetical protein